MYQILGPSFGLPGTAPAELESVALWMGKRKDKAAVGMPARAAPEVLQEYMWSGPIVHTPTAPL